MISVAITSQGYFEYTAKGIIWCLQAIIKMLIYELEVVIKWNGSYLSVIHSL